MMNTIRACSSLFLPNVAEGMERNANEVGDEGALARAVQIRQERNTVYVAVALEALSGLGVLTCPELIGKAMSGVMLINTLGLSGVCAYKVYKLFSQSQALAQPNTAVPHYV